MERRPMCNTESNAETTADESTSCCGHTVEPNTETNTTARFIEGDDVLTEPLPQELQTALGEFVGKESMETLAEWVAEVRQQTGGGAIPVDALCHASEETPHWGDMDGERYHFVCFYDAVILAATADGEVEIRTESPNGAVIEARAVGDERLDVVPEHAVFSFGIGEEEVENSDGNPTVEDFYTTGCPYVKAFPNRAEYEQWAESVPAYTAALPLAGATEIAAALAD